MAEVIIVEQQIKSAIIDVLKTVYDPEIPVNIYELGLIYDVTVLPSGLAHISMPLTSPACPAAQSLPAEVEQKTRAVGGITDVKLDLVWEPPWSLDMMSDEAKLELGLL